MGLFPSTLTQDHAANPGDPHLPVAPVNVMLGDDLAASPVVQQDLTRLQGQLAGVLAPQVAQHTVTLKLGRDGLVISLRESGFYDSGSALPHVQSRATLDAVAGKIAATPYDIRIEGHTDNVPIHTAEFDSNWELSSARATRIARLMLDTHALPPERISAAGYAEFHPVASNSTADGRAENRRVDLVVMPRTRINFAAPALSHPTSEWHKITDDDSPGQH
jgi:chemotaxis protein MotB